MKHPFYLKSNKEQKIIQLQIVLFSLIINGIFLWISFLLGTYFLVVLTIISTISIIAPFIDIPSLKKQGKLIYYSPLLIAEKEKKGVIKIHGGSLLDYVFVLDKSLNGNQRTTLIIQQYLSGILKLIDENSNNPSLKIKATSYILNERTANKIGLQVCSTDFIQKFLLLFNFPNILLSNSIAKKKFAFPNLTLIGSFEGDLEALMAKRDSIKKLSDKLKESIVE